MNVNTKENGVFYQENTCEKAEQIRRMLDEYWQKEQVKEKFVEFEEIMKTRSESKELVCKLFFGWTLLYG